MSTLTQKKEINYGLLVVLASRLVLDNEKYFFLISIIFFLGMLTNNSMRLHWPQVPGFTFYIISIVVAAVEGFLFFSSREVIRDLYYYIPTVLWVFIGYNLGRRQGGTELIKTLYCYGAMITFTCLMKLALNFNFSSLNLKSIFGEYVSDVGIILAVLIYSVFICKEVVFTVYVDRLFIALMSIQIALSLGRIAILEPLIIFFTATYLSYKYLDKKKILTRVAKIGVIAIVVLIIFLKVIPQDSVSFLLGKIAVSFSEIDADQTIASVEDAMVNWRGYEIQVALEQWKENNILQQIFGEGMGAGIHISYVPYNWKSFVIGNQIPLLHNGFMTHLIKGGILGVISMMIMMVSPLRKKCTGGVS